MEWRDANGNAFYVDDNGASTWEPPWADEDAEAPDEAPETTREAPDVAPQPPAPPPREAVAPQPPAPPAPVSKTDAVEVLTPMDRAAPKAPAYYGANAAEAETGNTYAPPRECTDLLAYERRRAAALVAAYQAERTKSRERRLRDDREALARDRAALDRERQVFALERLRGEHRDLPARSAVAALIVSTGLARNQ